VDRYCILCGRVIPKEPFMLNKKKCPFCLTDREMKQAVISLSNTSPETAILYECPCKDENKINHHPRYDKPFWVVRLCNIDHKVEHIRTGTLYGGKAIKFKEAWHLLQNQISPQEAT